MGNCETCYEISHSTEFTLATSLEAAEDKKFLSQRDGQPHLTGLEPIPYSDDNCEASNAFCKLSRVRDSCILLTGKRPYREYPMTWVVEELNRLGLKVLDAYKAPNTYTFEKVSVQADAARSTFPFFESKLTVEAMSQEVDRVERESADHCSKLEGGKFQLGFDWVITAEKQ